MGILNDVLKDQRSVASNKAKTDFQDRSWLIDRANLTMVRSCRKSIYAEFGIDIQLSQTDLLEQLHQYAAKSRDRNLPPMIDKLIDAANSSLPKFSQPVASAQQQEQSYYRGQALPQQNETPAPVEKKIPRIYRGQVIY